VTWPISALLGAEFVSERSAQPGDGGVEPLGHGGDLGARHDVVLIRMIGQRPGERGIEPCHRLLEPRGGLRQRVHRHLDPRPPSAPLSATPALDAGLQACESLGMQAVTGQRRQAGAVIVHAAAEARFALDVAAGAGVILLSAPGAAGFMGAPWWLALLRAAGAEPQGVLDCDQAPGEALAALRLGVRRLILLAEAPGFAAVAGAAAECGAELWPARPPALDLRLLDPAKPGARRKLAEWLAKGGQSAR